MEPTNHTRVNIEALEIYMKKKLDSSASSSANFPQPHIYRVNQKFKKVNPFAYKPELISIGPFHRQKKGKGSLALMEEHKLRCVKSFLHQTGKELTHYIKPLSKLSSMDKARKFYAETIKLDNNLFVEMMLLDGLFIIDLFQKYFKIATDQDKDPLLNNLWSIASLKRDILLLENQLPMHVLDHLFKITIENNGSSSSSNIVPDDRPRPVFQSVTELSLRFFDHLIMPERYILGNYPELQGEHLLDLLGKTLHPSSAHQSLRHPGTSKSVPSVTELRQAGVKFKKGSSTSRLLDIKFDNGVLEIPPISVHDLTETLLRNLIAYEQCSLKTSTYMISYAFFMDNLINSAEDVAFLCKQGIMSNVLGSHEDVSDLFNKLCNEATLEDFYYSGICDEVNAYYESTLHVWRATLCRDYFQNPWTILSLVAAVFLILLTVIQTGIAIYQIVPEHKLLHHNFI